MPIIIPRVPCWRTTMLYTQCFNDCDSITDSIMMPSLLPPAYEQHVPVQKATWISQVHAHATGEGRSYHWDQRNTAVKVRVLKHHLDLSLHSSLPLSSSPYPTNLLFLLHLTFFSLAFSSISSPSVSLRRGSINYRLQCTGPGVFTIAISYKGRFVRRPTPFPYWPIHLCYIWKVGTLSLFSTFRTTCINIHA